MSAARRWVDAALVAELAALALVHAHGARAAWLASTWTRPTAPAGPPADAPTAAPESEGAPVPPNARVPSGEREPPSGERELPGGERELPGGERDAPSGGGSPGDEVSDELRRLLVRNVFDSNAGPLWPPDFAVVLPPVGAAEVDPRAAPQCPDAGVRAVVEASDAEESVALLWTANDPEAHPRRLGEPVGSRVVAYIGYNSRERSPAVWLEDAGGGVCQVLVFDPRTSALPAQKPGKRGKRRARKARVATPAPAPVGPHSELKALVQRSADGRVKVDRRVVDSFLSDSAPWLAGTRARMSALRGGAPAVQLTQVPPGSLLTALGFAVGDRLARVNGQSLADRGEALALYRNLRDAAELTVELERRGAPLTVALELR